MIWKNIENTLQLCYDYIIKTNPSEKFGSGFTSIYFNSVAKSRFIQGGGSKKMCSTSVF